MNRDIKVEYTERYPCACMGALLVYINDVLEYRTKDFVFKSTGGVYITEESDEHVEYGKLVWRDEVQRDNFYKWVNEQEEHEEIITKVNNALSNVVVCCGGCI